MRSQIRQISQRTNSGELVGGSQVMTELDDDSEKLNSVWRDGVEAFLVVFLERGQYGN